MSYTTNGSINKTDDYSIFRYREDNREVHQVHVARLKASIQNHNDLHLNPIIVNKDMEVIDGQHRLAAAKALGIEVYYVIDEHYDPAKMITFNTLQKQWKPEDFLNYWMKHGREDYRKLKDFMDDLDFPLSAMLKWLSFDGGRTYKDFKAGSFKFSVNERLLKSLITVKKYIAFMKERNFKPQTIFSQGAFHEACRNFFMNRLVDHERFFARLEVTPYQLRYCQLWQDYFEQLVELYNYDMRKDRIRLIQDGQKRELQAHG